MPKNETPAAPKVLTAVEQQIHNTIYKPLVKQAIREVEESCAETGADFTIAAAGKRFAELMGEEISANRFRDILTNCGFIFQRITVIRELPATTE
jgi:hypothetical protein